tara:strand:- start:507 stop:689 length:183 start_codon:yes stop_codon:yes gene_type:complete
MRIVKVGKEIRLTMTNEEKAEITERNSLDLHIGYLNVLQQDISKVLTELLPKVKKKNGYK